MKPEDVQRVKDLLPTSLGSDEIRENIAADILRRSIFSARMEYASYLGHLRDVLARISAGDVNLSDARASLQDFLVRIGHDPSGNSLANPASRKRLELIIRTNRQMAASVARIENQTADSLADFPAWELRRFVGKGVPREDWHRRWKAAGDSVGWEGALAHTGQYPEWSFIALKSSPIWEALGNGTGGFRDAIGNPYPPFAYGSGLDWDDVDAETCERLGLSIAGAETVHTPTLAPDRQYVAEAERRTGFNLSEGL